MGLLMACLVFIGKSEAVAKGPSSASAPATSPKKGGKVDKADRTDKSSKRKKKEGNTSETGLGNKVRRRLLLTSTASLVLFMYPVKPPVHLFFIYFCLIFIFVFAAIVFVGGGCGPSAIGVRPRQDRPRTARYPAATCTSHGGGGAVSWSSLTCRASCHQSTSGQRRPRPHM